MDVKQTLISFSDNGQTELKHFEVYSKKYIVMGKKGGRVEWDLSNLITVPFQNRYLCLSNTSEYMVRIFDIETNRSIKKFTREYKRVKETKEDRIGGASIDGKMVVKPPQKYKNDIIVLHVVGDNLWVVTSTKDKKKGRLIDVFDLNGRYVDMFFLKLPEDPLVNALNKWKTTIVGDYLYAIESDEDDLVSIVKYRIDF